MSETAEERLPESGERRFRKLAWRIAWLVPLVIAALSLLIYREAPVYGWLSVSSLVLMALVITASVTDLHDHRIPNWLTYPAFLWALSLNLAAEFTSPRVEAILGAVGFFNSLAGAFVPFAFMLVIFSLTGGGAGDVKLTAALGAWLGLDRAIDAILLSFVAAGGLALLRGVWRLGPLRLINLLWRGLGHWLIPLWVLPPSQADRDFMRSPMPLGPSFAIGTLIVLLDLELVKRVTES